MRVALIHDALIPARYYGGTERLVWWIAKGLGEMGHEVVLGTRPGSKGPAPTTEVHSIDFSKSVAEQLPHADIYHYFATPKNLPARPYLVTIGGNAQPGETFLPNTVFVSRSHAQRHGSNNFVYNGVDPSDYEYSEKKSDYLLFLAKASWKVKNVRGAIRLARHSKSRLHIVGGSRWWLPNWRGVSWKGVLGGQEKATQVAGARALLFPVLWQEPFGLAVVEALVSGTPVIASSVGSLPELVNNHVGFLCQDQGAFARAIGSVGQIRPADCRKWALERFHYHRMVKDYLALYERAVRVGSIQPPLTQNPSSGGGRRLGMSLGVVK